MPNENKPNQDHWKELVTSLDLDVDFDEETPAKEEKSEDSGPIQEEKTTSDAVAKEPLSSSKVDPLFDLGWNTPEEGKEVSGQEKEKVETTEAQTPEKSIVEKPKKKPRKKKESRGFGFGLLPDEMFADEPEETPEPEAAAVESEPELTFADEESTLSEPIEERALSEEPTVEMSFDDDTQADDSEGASDWMALAAQLGVPIRSTKELKSEEASAEEPANEDRFVDEETGKEYDPLAAWGSPAPAGFRRSKDKTPQDDEPPVDFHEAIDADVADQEDDPLIIGKPREDGEDSDKPKSEPRRRGRRRGRRRTRDQQEVESVEIVEEEETLTSSTHSEHSDAESSEDEKSEERSSKDRRRRRSRRSRKPVVESEDRESSKGEDEDEDEELDLNVFDEEEELDDKNSGSQLKSHRGIPSWEEAIGMVIDKNLGTRNERSDEHRSSRSRGGRGRPRRSSRSKE